LASTGIGFTLSLMKDMDILATPLGQLVCAAAMIDDVSSMVLLAILKGATSLVETGEVNAFDMIKPVIASLGLFAGSIIARMLLCRYMSSGDEGAKDVEKAEQQDAASIPYLHENSLCHHSKHWPGTHCRQGWFYSSFGLLFGRCDCHILEGLRRDLGTNG
jgi:hypothetical protein